MTSYTVNELGIRALIMLVGFAAGWILRSIPAETPTETETAPDAETLHILQDALIIITTGEEKGQ